MAKPAEHIAEETIVALQQRIEPMMDAIDLPDDLPAEVESVIAIGELSGTDMDDHGKKLLLLSHRGVIDSDEYRRLVIAQHGA